MHQILSKQLKRITTKLFLCSLARELSMLECVYRCMNANLFLKKLWIIAAIYFRHKTAWILSLRYWTEWKTFKKLNGHSPHYSFYVIHFQSYCKRGASKQRT